MWPQAMGDRPLQSGSPLLHCSNDTRNLPSDARSIGEYQHHTVTPSHAALTMQSSVSKWADWLLHEAVWAIFGKIRWLTFMPSNQMQTTELSITQNGSTVFLYLSCTHSEIHAEASEAEGKYLQTKRFCPTSLITDLNLFYRRLLETNYSISCTFFFFFTKECVSSVIPGSFVFWVVKM